MGPWEELTSLDSPGQVQPSVSSSSQTRLEGLQFRLEMWGNRWAFLFTEHRPPSPGLGPH